MSYCRADDNCDFYIVQQYNGTFGLWLARNRFQDGRPRPIELPFAGEYFCYRSPKHLLAQIQKLRTLGYQMTDKIFSHVRARARKDQKNASALKAMLEPGTDAGLRSLVATTVSAWTRNYKRLLDKSGML